MCLALSLRDDGWGTYMSIRLPGEGSWFFIFLTDEDQTTGREYGKHLHEITLGTAGTAIWERQAQLVSQCPCLLLLMGFVYPVLVGFVCISGCSRHIGNGSKFEYEIVYSKYSLRNTVGLVSNVV